MNPKLGYTAQELADLRLSSLPHTRPGVTKKAKREGWVTSEREARGGGIEYRFENLPTQIQAEIRLRTSSQLLTRPVVTREEREERRLVAIERRDIMALNDKQREIADARLVVAGYVQRLADVIGVKAAVRQISAESRAETLPSDISRWIDAANARQGKPGVGERTLYKWVLDAQKCETVTERLATFAPQKQGCKTIKMESLSWLPDFLAVYRQTNGVCIAEAHRMFVRNWAARHQGDMSGCPDIWKVKRALKYVPNRELLRGRLTGSALRAQQTYVKRDWSGLMPNDVWMGDGHSLKMKVRHPDHGQPFTPELTMIVDAATRYIVGWSLAYSESTIAVADALRYAMSRHGVPCIYYSDNGGGQSNKIFDADLTGILPRLGVEHTTGIPGNPQGRGMIERLNQTVGLRIARQFETYYGTGADPDTVRKNLTGVASLAKATSDKVLTLTPKQRGAVGKLPTWDELLQVIEAVVDDYNHNHAHRELGGMTPAAMREQMILHASPDEMVLLCGIEARNLFRPQFVRRVQRGWLTWHNKHYWHADLENWDGKDVIIAVDQHDPGSVIVTADNGHWICDAKLDGNKRPGMPESMVTEARRKRSEAAIKRAKDKAERAAAELRPVIEAGNTATVHDLLVGEKKPAKKVPQYEFLTTKIQKEG